MSFTSKCDIVANNECCVTFTTAGLPTAAVPETPLTGKVGESRVQMNRHRDLKVQHFIWSNYNGSGEW